MKRRLLQSGPESKNWLSYGNSYITNVVSLLSPSLSPQVTASQLSPSSSHKPSILILADSDQERTKWVGLLNELHRILKKNKLKERFVYVPKEAYDSTLPLIKTTQSAAIIGGSDIWLFWRDLNEEKQVQ